MIEIKRHSLRLSQGTWPCFDATANMVENVSGGWVSYEDHEAIVKNLKEAHEQDLRKARERGYSDGQDSNYSWRL